MRNAESLLSPPIPSAPPELPARRVSPSAREPAAQRAAIIINAAAGIGDKEEIRRRLTEIFAAQGFAANIMLAREGRAAVRLAERALGEGYRTIVAGGGDGTISAIASLLVGTEQTLGVLPLGTLNHFAKDLEIPLDLEGAARNIIEGEAVAVDVGEVNGRVFLNNSSLGLYPSIVYQRERQRRRFGRSKWMAFVWAALTVLRRYPFMDVRVRVNEWELARRTPFVFIGNNEYEMEGFNVGARSQLNAGVLTLHLTNRTGRLGLLRLGWRALFGGLNEERDFVSLRGTEIVVEMRRRTRLRVALDGEVVLMPAPLHYRLRPGALRVLAPRKED